MIWDKKTVDYLELKSEPFSLKIHIHNYGYTEYDEQCGKWCNVSIEMKADDWLYFKCDEDELLETGEINELILITDSLLRNEMTEPRKLHFCEPAIKITAYQIDSERENKIFLYMEWTIYNTVKFTLYNEEIKVLNKYLKRVRAGLTEPEEDRDKNKKTIDIVHGAGESSDVNFHGYRSGVCFSVEENIEETMLEPVLIDFFDENLQKNRERGDRGFDHWGTNYYSIERAKKICDEFLRLAYLMETDPENYEEDETYECVKSQLSTYYLCASDSPDYGDQSPEAIERNIDVVASFYRRFAYELQELINLSDYDDFIVVTGP